MNKMTTTLWALFSSTEPLGSTAFFDRLGESVDAAHLHARRIASSDASSIRCASNGLQQTVALTMRASDDKGGRDAPRHEHDRAGRLIAPT
jgi:hypothetical protein